MIGIDLGTTNSLLSVDHGDRIEVEKTLPSFVFFTPDGEQLIGEQARKRGAEIPGRLIQSAKSWLSYDGVDRRSKFLPLGDCEQKLSPVEACALYLKQLKEHEGEVVVTVPASFDPSARSLVEEAAGTEVTLIEEPLAAFYDWIYQHESSWRDHLKVNDLVLVVDIGGGTTDFSLIRVLEEGGNLQLHRVAVGEHLLLGGDNIDLALAYHMKAKFGELDSWQWGTLIHAVREAKERLFAGVDEVSVTVAGRGSSLIGGSLQATLTREECETLLVEGFFPAVAFDEQIREQTRHGLTTLALPYVQDPRITAHLATFLNECPTTILFNGGTMKAEPFRRRLVEQVSAWRGDAVKVLPDADLDCAVSRGAAYYGRVKKGEGIRVRAPSARSYYIGVEGAAPAVPGMPAQITPVCIAPLGMEEGSEYQLETPFTLRLAESALFHFFSHTSSNEITSVGELEKLHPIETVLESEEQSFVRVTLCSKLTELGMLELWCVSENKRWKLEFDLRSKSKQPELAASS